MWYFRTLVTLWDFRVRIIKHFISLSINEWHLELLAFLHFSQLWLLQYDLIVIFEVFEYILAY